MKQSHQIKAEELMSQVDEIRDEILAQEGTNTADAENALMCCSLDLEAASEQGDFAIAGHELRQAQSHLDDLLDEDDDGTLDQYFLEQIEDVRNDISNLADLMDRCQENMDRIKKDPPTYQ